MIPCPSPFLSPTLLSLIAEAVRDGNGHELRAEVRHLMALRGARMSVPARLSEALFELCRAAVQDGRGEEIGDAIAREMHRVSAQVGCDYPTRAEDGSSRGGQYHLDRKIKKLLVVEEEEAA